MLMLITLDDIFTTANMKTSSSSLLPSSASFHSSPHLCREAAEEAVPEVDKGEGEVLVEEVAQKLAHPQVGPAAVHQQEALQKAELGERVVAGQYGLHSLLP